MAGDAEARGRAFCQDRSGRSPRRDQFAELLCSGECRLARGSIFASGARPELGALPEAVCSQSRTCPSSLIQIRSRQLSEVLAYSDEEARRSEDMRRPLPFLEIRSAAHPARPFLAQGGFDPRGSRQRTTGSRIEADTR